MSTPLQRAEELKSLISQYQAELSDIYSEIHSSKYSSDYQIISCMDPKIANEYRSNKTFELSSLNSENLTQIRDYPGYGENNKSFIMPFNKYLGGNYIKPKNNTGPNGYENQYRVMIRYKDLI